MTASPTALPADDPRPARLAPWRRNLYVVFVAELLPVTGFHIVLGFLPYYVQTLGVNAPEQIKLWSG